MRLCSSAEPQPLWRRPPRSSVAAVGSPSVIRMIWRLVVPIGAQQLARKAQRFFDIGAVLHEISQRNDRRKILRLDPFCVGAKRDEMKGVLGVLRFNQPMQRERNFLAGMERIIH